MLENLKILHKHSSILHKHKELFCIFFYREVFLSPKINSLYNFTINKSNFQFSLTDV